MSATEVGGGRAEDSPSSGRWPSVCASLLSLFALIVSVATLTLVALFYYQFQRWVSFNRRHSLFSLNLTEIHTSKRATYTPVSNILLQNESAPFQLNWMTPFDLEKYDTFLFDVDGTIKNADGYVPGSKELMLQLRGKNKTVGGGETHF